MTPKEFLLRYRTAEQEILCKTEELSRLEALSGKVTQVLPEAPRLDDLKAEIEESIKRLIGIRREVSVAINAVEDKTFRDLLHYRYICGMTWEKIAVTMNYTYQWVCVLHERALQEVKGTPHSRGYQIDSSVVRNLRTTESRQ